MTAKALLKEAIDMYRDDNNRDFPKEIFIHAKTYFYYEQWFGFIEACKGKTKLLVLELGQKIILKYIVITLTLLQED